MTAERRPLAVTLACVFVGFTSVLLFVNLMSVLSDWGSLELQDSVTTALESTALAGQDISLETALGWLRIAFMVLVFVAIAAAVFAVYAARGDRPSRIGLTIVCVLGALVFSTSGLVGLLPAVLLATSAFVLWSPEARVWFDLKNDREPSPATLAKVAARRGDGSERPALPEMYPGASAHGLERHHGQVPRSVATAAVTALISSGLVGLLCFSTSVAYLVRLVSPTEFERRFGDQALPAETLFGLTETEGVVTVVIVVSSALTIVAALGLVMSIALLMNRRWARIPLIVLSYAAVAASAAAFPAGLPVTLSAAIVILLLRRRESRDWAARR